MAIILRSEGQNVKYAYINIFPDQFKTEKQKQDPSWIKDTMDYFANKAYAEYKKNKNTFVKNYDLVKGILRTEDFYQEPSVKSFTDSLLQTVDLPSYVKHYSIITTPLNELIGELSKRPDEYRTKAFDDNSRSEELEYKTQLLQEYVISNARFKIQQSAALSGENLEEEQLETLVFEKVKDELDDYTSVAEKWSNHILNCTKAEFNLKEKSEDAFRDMCISSREFYHIYEDNSKLGYNIEVTNTKTTWFLTTPDRKYISDPSGRSQGAYAAGTIQVMELSEIIDSIPDITKEEIDHLRKGLEDYGLLNVRESNLFNDKAVGINSIKYDTYDPLVMQERMIIESELKENNDSLEDWLGLSTNVSAFGYKYVVLRSYWSSKKKIGKVSYIDEVGNEQTILVDENYKSGTIPTEINIEWGWVNQWYQGIKIGPDVYHVKPFKLLDYCPIIGIVHEIKNTEARSIIDLMKPFQVLYNICMNQLFDLLRKEIGNVASVNIRRIPRVKDGDEQDSIDMWEAEAKERGIIFDDDSPENTKAPVSNQTVAKSIDLTRSNEIQSRYNLAIALKNECWELIGMSKERMGSIAASQTATGTQTAVTQSYTQTEPLFVAHEYVLGQLYQAIIDASLYIESQKPLSTLSYITSQGQSALVQVNGTDLKFRDIKVFPTNRPEDRKAFEEIRSLSQAVMQNGGSLYDIIELYSTNSMRQMKKVFRTLKEKQDQFQMASQQQAQQELDQNAAIAQAELIQQRELENNRIANENVNKQLDRISKEKIAIIGSLGFGKVEGEDLDNDAVYDVLESGKLDLEREKINSDRQAKLLEMQNENMRDSEKIQLEKEKLQVARENMVNDKQIAQIQAKAAAKKQAQSKKKSKKK